MSPLTKVFVLLMSVLSIFLCGVVVSFVASTNNYKLAYEQKATVAEAAQILAKAADEAKRNESQRSTLIIERLQAEKVALLARISEYDSEQRVLEQELADAKRISRTAIQLSQSQQLSNKTLYEAQLALQDDIKKSHSEMSIARTQKIAMEQELSSIKAESMQVKASLRRNSEKISELEDENALLQQQLLQVELASSKFRQTGDRVSLVKPQVGGVPIRGQIKQLVDGLASISVGSASGVREGTVFRVIRNGKFLGELEITLVEPGEAAGQLRTHQGTIVEGDRVTTGFD